MKKILSFIFCLTVINLCYGQQAVIKGNVTDTLNHVKLSNAVVALLQAKDSILVTFTRSAATGNFQLDNIPAGKYLLLITYPSFADYVEPVTLSDTSVHNTGSIMLTLRSRLLHEVVIQQKVAAIKIKGDTTEFNADSYKTQANANVEDLLKKLPGIQVDNKGQITAQGEKVKKVLVDGEEFFGDDPTLVTKNLRADMVDKVQLFDKKSDQAAFTGVDDGQAAKTINLKLKENKKNGYFGKISTGAGLDGFHETSAMLNMFRGKMKFSAYGIVSNTGKMGLDWNEREKYGQGMADQFTPDGSGDLVFNGTATDDMQDWSGKYEGKGYPLVQTGGLHFNNKWNADKNNINGNLKTMQLYMDGNSVTNTQNIMPDNTTTFRNVRESFNNSIMRNSLNGFYERQLDSSSSLTIRMDGGLDHKITNSRFASEFIGADSALVNQNERRYNAKSDISTLSSNILWRKKLKKQGRTLSLNFSENYSRTKGDGFLDSKTDYFANNAVDSTQHTDQYKTTNNESINVNGNITYTEPLSPKSSLMASYGINITNSHSSHNSFNKADGKYALLDSTFSNDYAFNMLTHKGGLFYVFNAKKLRINIGGNVGLTGYDQQDRYQGSTRRRDFVNWFPAATLRYTFSQQRRLNFSYNGNTGQPSINQLQPLRSNEDEQNVYIGNPDLKPSFRNNFRITYSDYKVISERNLWISLMYNTSSNDFSDYTTIDAKGRRTTQAVNVNGNQNAGMDMTMGWRIKGTPHTIGYNLTNNYYRNVNFIEGQQNITRSFNGNGSIYFMSSKEKVYEAYAQAEARFNTSTSSVQKSIRTDYWTYTFTYSMDLFLPWKLVLHSEANYNIRQKTAVFTGNNNACILNAGLMKKFGKKEALQAGISVNDMLNQNIGFSRSVNSNYITQNTWSSIGRYGMLSVTWNFNKAGGAASKD
ncbi:outer membrane beta-barrel protein (plasmid) [Chitinophaga sp. Mgbs1]|uniref:Outer membrane beta-barrel protein n=1 Tax=Chitinophaga solisilvae TaxID=1233460 RepID=A0A3S1DR90_9BACT|nr:outer membrane beta-barrel protein [Chitinophaga solisilvae]